MTPNQIALVQNSWTDINTSAESLGKIFFVRLFELDPTVRELFKNEIDAQSRQFINMLNITVNGLDQLTLLTETLSALGMRHSNFGVLNEHYDTMRDALLWTLAQKFGDKFTPELENAWNEAFSSLTTIMKVG